MSLSHNFVRELWFIRHGESQANAGFATSDPASIPLTDLGRRQAQVVSQLINIWPDLIITSPYIRTQETAKPTLQRFASTPHQTWPIQEFTYLAPGRCINTNRQDRKAFVKEYWTRSDPDFIDGQGAESFSGMIERVRCMWQNLCVLKNEEFIVIFTHGLFMNALRWSMAHSFAPLTQQLMADFHTFHYSSSPVPNCSILKCKLDCENQAWFEFGAERFTANAALE